MLSLIRSGQDSVDATALANHITANSSNPKTLEYISLRFKQLSAMSIVTADKADITPAQKTELTAATTRLPTGLLVQKTAIQALIDNSP